MVSIYTSPQQDNSSNSPATMVKKVVPALAVLGILYYLFAAGSSSSSSKTKYTDETQEWYSRYIPQFAKDNPYSTQELKDSVIQELAAEELAADAFVRRLMVGNGGEGVVQSGSVEGIQLRGSS
mmetsp:Transcript_5711/g.11200  ORF Transcript_5711/g.11200 Transcript_5711/m.11200 type:complete len:124 (+) Transcript_5711:242-613(+)